MTSLGNKEIFANNLKYYLEKTNKKNVDVCKDLGIKESTFSDWCNGKMYPRIDNIEKLATYFGIKKSDLVEDRAGRESSLPNELDGVYYSFGKKPKS